MTDPILLDNGAGRAENELLGCGGEVREASDGKIFMVEVWISPEDFIGLQTVLATASVVFAGTVYLLDDR